MRRWLVAAVGVLLLTRQPAQAVDKAEIDKAVERGVAALKKMQGPDGTWTHPEIGATALAGLTLLECGVPAEDKAVQRAAARVRQAGLRCTQTYSLSLSVLFLDRLDNPADTPLIESMIIRLLAGQQTSGGWNYHCPEMEEVEVRRLTEALGGAELKGSTELARLPAKGKRTSKDLSKESQAQYARMVVARRLVPGLSTDNSNTQFATLALWVGRRYGVPVQPALKAVEQRFRLSQNRDGGWGYMDMPPGVSAMPGMGGSTATMTCAGLLGLAVGHGVAADVARSRDPKAGPRDIDKDAKIKLGLQALSTAVGTPAGKWAGRGPKPAAVAAGGKAYYFLWSLERVCVALNLETIGKKDWYAWGAEILLANQQRDGAWMGEYGAFGADTCFALLFLKRANLARDLTASIRGCDIARELRGGGVDVSSLKGPPLMRLKPTGIGEKPDEKKPDEKEPKKPDGERTAVKGPPKEPVEKSRVPEDGPAGLARELERASARERSALLARLRDAKGVANTEALAGVIPRLEGETRREARDALAERLARMKAATLRSYLKDEDTEIRRAAAIACAMQEEKGYVPDLIRLLSDPEQAVERAAVAALRELTGQNFGPPAGASRADRAKAIAAWELWWRKQTRE